MEFLNDKPTAIIRKASSIHNFEFNLIRHPANFITYLTGLLIQFTLLLFQRTAPGPVWWEMHQRTHLGMLQPQATTGNAAALSPHSPDTQHFSWDKGTDHVLGFIFPPVCKEVQKSSKS